MTIRISKKIVAGIDMIQFEEALSQYAGAETRESEIMIKLDSELARIKDKYAAELSYLQDKKKIALEVVETYCREQKKVLFNKRRTLHTLYGAVGFRLGNPKLKIARGTSLSLIMKELKEKLPEYVRVTEEPAKDMLIADRHKESVANLLQTIGLQVIQDETFFVELKPLVTKIINDPVNIEL